MVKEDGSESSPQLDPAVFRARRNVEALGMNGDYGEALMAASSFADFENVNAAALRLGFQADNAQILGFVFPRIYNNNRDSLLKAAEQRLSPVLESCGVPATDIGAVVTWSLEDATQMPGHLFGGKMEDDYGKVIDGQKKAEFENTLLNFMFDVVRDYLSS